MLIQELAERWWLIALRGGLALLLGLGLVMYPAKTLTVITWVVGLWALVEGIALMVMALIKHVEVDGWGLLFFQGLLGVFLGVVLMALPAISLGIVFFLVGLWLVLVGIVLVVEAMQVRQEILGGEWLLLATAILSMLFGVFLIGNLQVGVAVAGLLLGIMMLVFGMMTIAFGFQLKREANKIKKLTFL